MGSSRKVEPRVQAAVEAIYTLFFHGEKWPTFEAVDKFLDNHGEAAAEEALLAAPSGLLYGIAPGRGPIREVQEVALTAAGLALCESADEDLSHFIAAVRAAADLEREVLAGETATMSSDTIDELISLPAAGRAASIARLGEILRVENWGSGGSSLNAGTWSTTITRHVRRNRDVVDVDDYLIRLEKAVGAAPTNTAPPTVAVAQATVAAAPGHDIVGSSEELTLFISYSHADKTLAVSLQHALENCGVRVWVDEVELRTGDSIINQVSTAIAEVHFVAAIVSENSVRSAWCTKELSLAATRTLAGEGVVLLPLRAGEVKMPAALTDLLHQDIGPETDFERLAAILVRHARSHRRDAARPQV